MHDSTTVQLPTLYSQLRETLNKPAEQYIEFPMTTSDSSQQFSTPVSSILNFDGSLDVNKFTESVFQSNQNMKQLLSQSFTNASTTNLNKLKEKRLLEDPPLLKDNANYRDYVIWIDKILCHLQRHPDFRPQFLTASPPTCLKSESQERLIDVYDFIKDKINHAMSSNMKIQNLILPYHMSFQVHLVWKKIMDHFLPDTETAKQEREDTFNNLVQSNNETNSEFVKRVQFEMDILKFVHQDISEARFRLRVMKGLRNEFHRSMIQLNSKLNLPDWLDYLYQLETINNAFSTTNMSTHISNVTVSKENDSSIKSSSTSCQALLTPNQKMCIDNTADRLNRHISSQRRRPSLQIPDRNYICYHCEGKGHYRHNCPLC